MTTPADVARALLVGETDPTLTVNDLPLPWDKRFRYAGPTTDDPVHFMVCLRGKDFIIQIARAEDVIT